jgi:catechol 2,3-dioxygenase-like lactoylglutathione lyase family enzyme
MFDHIGLRVKDLRSAVRFYTALLAPTPTETMWRRCACGDFFSLILSVATERPGGV